jgi:hypothetical protein
MSQKVSHQTIIFRDKGIIFGILLESTDKNFCEDFSVKPSIFLLITVVWASIFRENKKYMLGAF